jgi:hypothetical protein
MGDRPSLHLIVVQNGKNENGSPYTFSWGKDIGIPDEEYSSMARRKLETTLRTKCSSGTMSRHPLYVQSTEPLWSGSFIDRFDENTETVVSVSGVKEYQDEAIAHVFFVTMDMLAKADAENLRLNNGGIVK